MGLSGACISFQNNYFVSLTIYKQYQIKSCMIIYRSEKHNTKNKSKTYHFLNLHQHLHDRSICLKLEGFSNLNSYFQNSHVM